MRATGLPAAPAATAGEIGRSAATPRWPTVLALRTTAMAIPETSSTATGASPTRFSTAAATPTTSEVVSLIAARPSRQTAWRMIATTTGLMP